MTRFASRLFIVTAMAVGGFLAVSNLRAGTGDLPAVPTPGNASVSTGTAGTPDADLSRWQETRLKIKTSNVIP